MNAPKKIPKALQCLALPKGGDGSAWCVKRVKHKGLHDIGNGVGFRQTEPGPFRSLPIFCGHCRWGGPAKDVKIDPISKDEKCPKCGSGLVVRNSHMQLSVAISMEIIPKAHAVYITWDRHRWIVRHIDRKLDPESHYSDYGAKVFFRTHADGDCKTKLDQKWATFKTAVAWIEREIGIKTEWVTNSARDYVPAEVNEYVKIVRHK